MEEPKPYHVRPDPQQPHRGGKELISALDDLEAALSDKIPDIERLKLIQKRIHDTANTFNDDRLVDMIRLLSQGIDSVRGHPDRRSLEKILHQLLKIKVELKHLR